MSINIFNEKILLLLSFSMGLFINIGSIYLCIILVPIYAYAAWQTNPEKVNYYSFYNTFLSTFLFPKLLWLIIILKNLSFAWTLLFTSLILDILTIIVLSFYFYKISEN